MLKGYCVERLGFPVNPKSVLDGGIYTGVYLYNKDCATAPEYLWESDVGDGAKVYVEGPAPAEFKSKLKIR